MPRSSMVPVSLLVAAGVAFAALIVFGFPYYNVWEQGMSGRAKLEEAKSSRQVAIEEAHAKMESAKMLSDAEIERARGVAEANKIIGESLSGPGGEAYLRYLWLHNLEAGQHDIIYVPTEANMPIMEAGRRMSK